MNPMEELIISISNIFFICLGASIPILSYIDRRRKRIQAERDIKGK